MGDRSEPPRKVDLTKWDATWSRIRANQARAAQQVEEPATLEPPPPLFRQDWVEREGIMEPVQSPDLFVWACVNADTGEVDLGGIEAFDDELDDNLIPGWEWRRFRLVEGQPAQP